MLFCQLGEFIILTISHSLSSLRMSSGPTTPTDLFTQKTDTEFLYFLEHPDLYHADVVAAAQQELHRREVSTRSHLTEVAIAKIDSTFPGKASLVYDQWRELTRVLVYNHNLRPVMQDRVNMMHDIANRRMESLQQMRENYSLGRPPMNSEVLKTLAPVEDMLYEPRGGK